jgi:hypothetical protein
VFYYNQHAVCRQLSFDRQKTATSNPKDAMTLGNVPLEGCVFPLAHNGVRRGPVFKVGSQYKNTNEFWLRGKLDPFSQTGLSGICI